MRTFILLCALMGGIVAGLMVWRSHTASDAPRSRDGAVTIDKLPVKFAARTFDPAAPPSEMPPLAAGEEAVCDSDFLSSASVGGNTRREGVSRGTITVSHVRMTLQLSITVWTPEHATQHVRDHEEGHREISEYYYRTADQVAREIASDYVGRRVGISGPDLDKESDRVLLEMAHEITTEYGKRLNTEPTQLLYDSITDHARNEVLYTDAVNHAIKNVAVEYHPGDK